MPNTTNVQRVFYIMPVAEPQTGFCCLPECITWNLLCKQARKTGAKPNDVEVTSDRTALEEQHHGLFGVLNV